jgi:hypothetical protein
MSIKIKSQKDCLTTKVAIESTADLNELDALMRASKSTGSIVATYNQGGRMNVNIEQNKHISDKLSEKVRDIVGIGTKELECE